jgi:hypothetical protein
MSKKFVFGGSFTSVVPLLLDLYPAAIAFSVRKIRTEYSGACMRVRRSSDNTEQDIGFDLNGDLDTTALLAFVGSGDGFVTVWYGQDVVSVNLTQATLTRQPRIVFNGGLVLNLGKPAINFHIAGNVNHSNLNNQNIPIGSRVTANSSFYGVSRYTSNTQRRLFISDFANTYFTLFPDSEGSAQGSPSSSPSLTQAHINGNLQTIGTRGQLRAVIGVDTFLAAINNYALLNGNTFRIELGREGSVIGALDFYQELIIYRTDQTSNRVAIETNINNYYGIY